MVGLFTGAKPDGLLKKGDLMRVWLFRIGLLLLVVGVVLLSPLIDVLPVGFLRGAYEGKAYRIVPSTDSSIETTAYFLLVLGALALISGYLARRGVGPK